MAKLSAHGYEVARIKYVETLPEREYEVTLSFRSDGHIMRNLKALNIHRPLGGLSPHHVYGWKLYKKLADPKRDTIGRMKNLAVRWANGISEGENTDLLDSTI